MILLIDNYDSFVYNLYQYLGEINPDVSVYRNDEITLEAIKFMDPTHIVLSPGPGHPKDTNICLDIIKELGPGYPILGVCLGHQAIGYAYDSKIAYAKNVLHGKKDTITIGKETDLLNGSPSFEAARYHSLVIDESQVGEALDIVATSSDGEIMAVKHKKYHVYGLQFHPESILTFSGKKIINKFLKVG